MHSVYQDCVEVPLNNVRLTTLESLQEFSDH